MAAPKGNKFAVGNKGGKPRIFKTSKQLQARVDEFFVYCDKEKKRPKLTGLYNFLDVWPGYFGEKEEEFTNIIKHATAKISGYYENALDDKSTPPALGIFMLKNCGYTDRVEINATVSDNTSLTDMAKAAQRARAKQGKHV